jgi:hypothetical protein
MKWLNKTIREPLFQFFIIGALIYLAYGLFNQDIKEQENVIVITKGEIQWLEDNWVKTRNRPPSSDERQGLINQHVRQKVMYKTAVEMGLDQDDMIIERRMVQKLEFLTSDIMTTPEPQAGELEKYYRDSQMEYKTSSAITITQIFFDPDKRERRTLTDAENALKILRKRGEPNNRDTGFGDVFMLQSYYSMISDVELAKLFGRAFASEVFTLEPGNWYGPLLSGYGTHLLYVHELREGTLPAFEEISDVVKVDWEKKKLEELNDLYEEGLLSRYEIIIEGKNDNAGFE